MNNKENLYSYLTAKERDNPSLPIRILLDRNLIVGKVLDFGCGFGKDVEYLKQKGFDCKGFDPHYFPTILPQKFDTIICFYVLNVLFPEEQNEVLMEISRLLKPTGKAYFAVRRDIQKDGFRIHQLHGKPTYQCNVKLPYKSIFLNQNTEFYEYQHINQLNILSKCPFCNPNSKLRLIAETPLSYAVLDGFPISNGHSLIIPKRHIANFFDLSFEEQNDCLQVANKVQRLIKNNFQNEGFTVGLNIGKVAGQKFDHASIHVIPRYQGDIPNPTGGIRNILK